LKAQITTNDVIFPNRGARDSQVNGSEPIGFLITERFKEANINPQLTLLRSNKQITLPEFLVVALNSPIFLAQFRKATTGSALRFINLTTTKQIGFPLPPLNEQGRIVNEIEQLTDRSNKARAALADVPKLIEQFRQSVLAAAFRGDLTADWR
jgi:type I restriction enzyme, S subunit